MGRMPRWRLLLFAVAAACLCAAVAACAAAAVNTSTLKKHDFFTQGSVDDDMQPNPRKDPNDPRYQPSNSLKLQLLIASTLGISAFISFCLLRIKWKTLYAARFNIDYFAQTLPRLTTTPFRWIVQVYNIPMTTVLENSGLDAFIFLIFFRMAARFCFVAALIGTFILIPVRNYFAISNRSPLPGNDGNTNGTFTAQSMLGQRNIHSLIFQRSETDWKVPMEGFPGIDKAYLYTYFLSIYVYTLLLLWLLFNSTKFVAYERQRFLARNPTIATRTVRISGIPENFRSEMRIENLLISSNFRDVEHVSICRNYSELDNCFKERGLILSKLEQVYTIFEKSERRRLMQSLTAPVWRPKMRLGPFGIFGQPVDKIDFYKRKLELCDLRIHQVRSKATLATESAYVTFSSILTAQLCARSLLFHAPDKFKVSLAAPSTDITWQNTYLSRRRRITTSWLLTVLCLLITFLWVFPIGTIAAAINRDAVRKWAPRFADWLDQTPVAADLLFSFFPTLVYTIFIALSPYLFDYISSQQRFISKSEEEFASVSKNFFFNFVTYFLAFVIADTVTFWLNIAKDATRVAYLLANALINQSQFYTDLIVLQGIGMLSFRLLEFGTLISYPFSRFMAKTPRELEELSRAPLFNFAHYLPQSLLIYIICLFYSVVSPPILIFGLIYFFLGFGFHKYQLLYAMDHTQQSSGRMWMLIFDRIVFGVYVYHIAMAGYFSLQKSYMLALMIFPLTLAITFWSRHFRKMYEPHFYYIALEYLNIRDAEGMHQSQEWSEDLHHSYTHPLLTRDLEQPWHESVTALELE